MQCKHTVLSHMEEIILQNRPFLSVMKYIYVKSTAGVMPNKVLANIYWILTRCKATGLTASHVSSCILIKTLKGGEARPHLQMEIWSKEFTEHPTAGHQPFQYDHMWAQGPPPPVQTPRLATSHGQCSGRAGRGTVSKKKGWRTSACRGCACQARNTIQKNYYQQENYIRESLQK